MTKIIIDEQFKAFLPALDAKTFSDLERDIINHGVRDAIVLWDGILIDGYNRHAICVKHDLPFRTVSMEFSSRDEVLIWIINNQIIRRNLTPLQLSYFRGVHYRAEKKIITNVDGRNQYKEVAAQNGHQPKMQSTATKLANHYDVSPNTIRRNSQLSESIDAIGEISPEA
ncbi:MAG: hypothetical protein LBD23_13720, partial [Oscillospiraceae bacterium]|nr:hypothetical protein [Oscillospiraceae bacterium]